VFTKWTPLITVQVNLGGNCQKARGGTKETVQIVTPIESPQMLSLQQSTQIVETTSEIQTNTHVMDKKLIRVVQEETKTTRASRIWTSTKCVGPDTRNSSTGRKTRTTCLKTRPKFQGCWALAVHLTWVANSKTRWEMTPVKCCLTPNSSAAILIRWDKGPWSNMTSGSGMTPTAPVICSGFISRWWTLMALLTW
jgi:hypothetical protein